MDFFLFLLVTGTLFIRPAEIVPALLGLPLYEVSILACVVASARRVGRQLTPQALAAQPVTACVVGLLGAVLITQFVHFSPWGIKEAANQFGKVVLYYLLLVAIVNTPRRMERFLVALTCFIVVLTAVALLQYHGYIELPAITVLEQNEIDPETGDLTVIPRLRSTGIYNDPNDLSLILVQGIIICLYGLGRGGRQGHGLRRLAWVAPLLLFAYALALTKSRGGFLALLVALVVLFRARYGWKKTLALGAVALPVLLLGFAGRQTSLSTGQGTSQERIQLWSEGLDMFRQSPLFGIGYNEYPDHMGLVAHNSYVHCYTELGFLGGTLFFGMFLFALLGLRRAGRVPRRSLPPGLARLHPYVTAMTAAYAAGLLSLSRHNVASTYVFLGLGASYVTLALARQPALRLRFNFRLVQRLALTSAGFLLVIYLFVRTFANWS